MEDKFIMFRNRLEKVHRHLSRQAERLGVGCFRLYDHDLPEFPFCIELYEENIYAAEYLRRHHMTESDHANWIAGCRKVLSTVLSRPEENIYFKLRMRKPSRHGQYRRQDESRNEFVVRENGLQFIINLSDYLDTGLFLDHRTTRQRVRNESNGKSVLNLFAYTGSFSVYAAAGGASEIVSVDLSNTYLDWAKRNFTLNNLVKDKYSFVRADVVQWLESAPENRFDIVILDPPTFSNSKKMEGILDIQRDHTGLLNQCLKTLKTCGHLFFSTNFKKFILDDAAIVATEIKDITKATTPFDFEGRLDRKCFLLVK